MAKYVAALEAWSIVALVAVRVAAEPPNAVPPTPAPRAVNVVTREPPGAGNLEIPRENPALEAHRARLTANLRPDVKAKLKEPIRRTGQAAERKTTSPSDLVEVANRSVAASFGGLSKTDNETMAFVVLLEAEKDAREDVKQRTARVEAVQRAKACQGAVTCLEELATKGGVSHEVAQQAIDDAKNKRDSLSELGETESLRLQAAMDRLTKLTWTLRRLLRKISDTSETIIQNLK